MVKLICPIDACHQTDFDTPRPTQLHITSHLRAVHGIDVNAANLAAWRHRQNEAWTKEFSRLEAERSAVAERDRHAWAAFAHDPSLGVPRSSATDAFTRRYCAVMLVEDDDDDDDGEDPSGDGSFSSPSTAANDSRPRLRPQSRISTDRAPVHDPLGSEAKRCSEWFTRGGIARGYQESLRSTLEVEEQSMVFATDFRKYHDLREDHDLRRSQRKMGDALQAYCKQRMGREGTGGKAATATRVGDQGEGHRGVVNGIKDAMEVDLEMRADEGVEVMGV